MPQDKGGKTGATARPSPPPPLKPLPGEPGKQNICFFLSTVGTNHIGSNGLKQAMDDDSTNDPENPKEAKKDKMPALFCIYIYLCAYEAL
jgi:hypothetical protein